jgi:predicted nucleic acid-binding protein
LNVGIVLDTTFLIDLTADEPAARAAAEDLDARHVAAYVPTPALYEILAGLHYRGSRSHERLVRARLESFPLLSFTHREAERAAEIRAELMALGRPKAHTDVMIAGIAVAHGHDLITRDADFATIAEAVGFKVHAY